VVANQPEKAFAPSDFDWSKRLSGGPLSHGFDYYFGDDVPNFPPYAWFENDRVATEPSEPLKVTAKTMEGEWEVRPGPMTPGWDFYAVAPRLTEKSVEWIGRQRAQDGPFFLYAPLNTPHAPIVPGGAFAGRSGVGGYGDFMMQTDADVGRVLRALDENGFAENTLVIFTADNGPEFYAYERVRKYRHRSAGPLRGLKRDLYEGGHRVPFLVRWPRAVRPGSVSDALVSQVDLFATLSAIAGYDLPTKVAEDSYDLGTVWKHNAPSPRRTIVHNTFANAYAVRHDQWLLVANQTGAHNRTPAWFELENGYSKNEHPGELYDLRADLSQRRNLYAEHPDTVNELKNLLESVRAKGQVR
jgi:arylsulfatase A